MNKVLLIATLILGAVIVGTTVANATESSQYQEQEGTQKGKQECKLGAYGQDATCTQEFEQTLKQSQSQVLADSVVIKDGKKVHIPVNTALDTQSMLAAVSVTALGGVAYAVRRKIA